MKGTPVKKMIAMLLLLLAGATGRAENITNKGKVYFDVAIVTSRCNAVSVTFSHKSGIAKLDFMELSERNKKAFGFDAVRYQEFKDEKLRLQQQAPPPQQAPLPLTAPTDVAPPDAAPPDATLPEPPPLAPSKDFTPIKRVVVITNAPPQFTPFSASPATTLQPDQNKMNEARLKAIKKGMELHSGIRQ